MTPSSPCRRRHGFTLLELAIALVIVALLASSLALPLAAQLQMRRYDETRRMLEEARDALLGFAVAHGRLPCPAAAATGDESFAPGGDPGNGRCANFYGGFLPAAALGLSGVDPDGFLRDAWGTVGNRIRYAVHGGAIAGVENALTRANGLQVAGLPALGAAPHYLMVCSTGAAASAGSCGPAANQLTRRAAFVLVSTGPNGGLVAAPASDEARNLDGDLVFVAREQSDEFDDLLQWTAIHQLVNRMLVAGRLP
ncbi:MAG TPA: prepilin-type N-terminal cleavage/methylation domain-containing protein [Usitatibacter sp.]|nr:prepilin-type N-terminal cleavage/methylation domain-containing protein [Usitatibacter sp.]